MLELKRSKFLHLCLTIKNIQIHILDQMVSLSGAHSIARQTVRGPTPEILSDLGQAAQVNCLYQPTAAKSKRKPETW